MFTLSSCVFKVGKESITSFSRPVFSCRKKDHHYHHSDCTYREALTLADEMLQFSALEGTYEFPESDCPNLNLRRGGNVNGGEAIAKLSNVPTIEEERQADDQCKPKGYGRLLHHLRHVDSSLWTIDSSSMLRNTTLSITWRAHPIVFEREGILLAEECIPLLALAAVYASRALTDFSLMRGTIRCVV